MRGLHSSDTWAVEARAMPQLAAALVRRVSPAHHSMCRRCHLRLALGKSARSDRPATLCAAAPPRRSAARCRPCSVSSVAPSGSAIGDADQLRRCTSETLGGPRDARVIPHDAVRIAVGRHLRRAAIDERGHRQCPAPAGRPAALGAEARSRATRSAKTSPSSREFDASRLAPCTPVRETSPHGIEARDAGPPTRSVTTPAHHVVRRPASPESDRRADRSPARDTARRCRGTVARTTRPAARIEIDVAAARCSRKISRATTSRAPAPPADGRSGMNAHPGRVQQASRLPRAPPPRSRARGFSGVSSAVGWNCTNSMSASPGARPMRDGVAIAGGDLRVRGVAVDLAAPAGRQHRRVGQRSPPALAGERWRAPQCTRRPRRAGRAHAGRSRTRIAGDSPARGHQRARDLGPGLIAVRVHDALPASAPPPSKLKLAVGREVEIRAGRRQLPGRGRALPRPAPEPPPHRTGRRPRPGYHGDAAP